VVYHADQCLGWGCYNNLPAARLDWVKNQLADRMPASSAGRPWWKGHFKTTGPAPVQGANRRSREALTRSPDKVCIQG